MRHVTNPGHKMSRTRLIATEIQQNTLHLCFVCTFHQYFVFDSYLLWKKKEKRTLLKTNWQSHDVSFVLSVSFKPARSCSKKRSSDEANWLFLKSLCVSLCSQPERRDIFEMKTTQSVEAAEVQHMRSCGVHGVSDISADQQCWACTSAHTKWRKIQSERGCQTAERDKREF